jgi:hypothetical protein
MSRTFDRLTGSGVGGAYQATDYFGFQSAQKLKNMLDLLGLGCFFRNLYGGGSETLGLAIGVGTGYVRALEQIEIEIDNTGNQVSNADDLICQVTVCVRAGATTSPPGVISVTPRVYNLTDTSVPTQSGAAACSATAEDFSGTSSAQTISFTPAAGKKKYIVQVAKSADVEEVFCARIAWSVYSNG